MGVTKTKILAQIAIVSAIAAFGQNASDQSRLEDLGRWAGFGVVSENQNPKFTGVSGSWTVVSPTPSTDGKAAGISQIISIGGANLRSDKPLQTGTACYASDGVNYDCSAFYLLSKATAAVGISGIKVLPGDQITASIERDPTVANNWIVRVSNESSGVSRGIFVEDDPSQSSIMWILKTPAPLNGKEIIFPQFGGAEFAGGARMDGEFGKSLSGRQFRIAVGGNTITEGTMTAANPGKEEFNAQMEIRDLRR